MWVEKYVVGKITREELDTERVKEINSADLMQYQSIIYHSESILETQVICLIFFYCIEKLYYEQLFDVKVNDADLKPIMSALLIEHILSYLINIYRQQEIKYNGLPDVNGVIRAPIESFLLTVE